MSLRGVVRFLSAFEVNISLMMVWRLKSGDMLRVRPVHYNTVEEIERFGEALAKIVTAH